MAAEETQEQLDERHERELEDLKTRSSAHLEIARVVKGKKGKAAVDAAEREVEQWRYELSERHSDELERFQEGVGGDSEITAVTDGGEVSEKHDEEAAIAEKAQQERDDERERADRKKEKAQRKKQTKSAKEADREAELERERLEAGPAARDLELAALTTLLAQRKPALKVFSVAADGNCLYHAVGDQIRRVRPELHKWQSSPDRMYEEVRALCSESLRKNEDQYGPFAELADGEDFARYCDRVEKSGDWGGELELRALAEGLRVQILVHRAQEAQPLEFGDATHSGEPLQLTYHRHYYALGEHYNAAIPQDA